MLSLGYIFWWCSISDAMLSSLYNTLCSPYNISKRFIYLPNMSCCPIHNFMYDVWVLSIPVSNKSSALKWRYTPVWSLIKCWLNWWWPSLRATSTKASTIIIQSILLGLHRIGKYGPLQCLDLIKIQYQSGQSLFKQNSYRSPFSPHYLFISTIRITSWTGHLSRQLPTYPEVLQKNLLRMWLCNGPLNRTSHLLFAWYGLSYLGYIILKTSV